jgi:hypothetical protein
MKQICTCGGYTEGNMIDHAPDCPAIKYEKRRLKNPL